MSRRIGFLYEITADCERPGVRRLFSVADRLVTVGPSGDRGSSFDALPALPPTVTSVSGPWLRRSDLRLGGPRVSEEITIDVRSFERAEAGTLLDRLVDVLDIERCRYSIDLVLDVLAGFQRIVFTTAGAGRRTRPTVYSSRSSGATRFLRPVSVARWTALSQVACQADELVSAPRQSALACRWSRPLAWQRLRPRLRSPLRIGPALGLALGLAGLVGLIGVKCGLIALAQVTPMGVKLAVLDSDRTRLRDVCALVENLNVIHEQLAGRVDALDKACQRLVAESDNAQVQAGETHLAIDGLSERARELSDGLRRLEAMIPPDGEVAGIIVREAGAARAQLVVLKGRVAELDERMRRLGLHEGPGGA